jgi:hypothetical protein
MPLILNQSLGGIRMYYGYDMQRQQGNNLNTQYQTMVDPFVVQTLQTVVGKVLIVQTTRDTIRGILKDVKPDHVMLMAGDSPFFIRIQQIVSIMPDE